MKSEDSERRDCDEATERAVSDGAGPRVGYGDVDASEPRCDCGIAYCPDAGTHLVVLSGGRSDHRRERYCESHVGVAADDARADPARELVYGPVKLE